MSGPLRDVRILDLTTVVMGPYATQILGDMGADVIKVEAPGGDTMRHVGPMRSSAMGPLFLNANRSKRSLCLDLKNEAGRQALLDLATTADILVCNVRPSAMARLGLSYADLKRVNDNIIYVSAVGYGAGGPYAGRPAYDDLIQGATLLPSFFADVNDGEPRYVPSAVADRICGLFIVNSILAALHSRNAGGGGQEVEIPMFETMASFILSDHLGGMSFRPPLDDGGYARQLSPHRRPYRTIDGHICALVFTDAHWRSFFRAIGQEDRFASDPRMRSVATRTAHIDAIYEEVAEIFLSRTTAEWEALLSEADVPFSPYHTLRTIFHDPHLTATEFFTWEDHPTEGALLGMRHPTRWSKTQPSATRPSPRLGEHNAELLREIGYDEQAISRISAAAGLSTDSAPVQSPGQSEPVS
jgi:crotonobetainyl-CoA:carnitine CoA-transferase CaiB-like acyl-CoA transferase